MQEQESRRGAGDEAEEISPGYKTWPNYDNKLQRRLYGVKRRLDQFQIYRMSL